MLRITSSFSAPEHLSALVIHEQSQDILGSMHDLDGEVITLTHLPRSKWQTLLNLDVIQVSFPSFSVSYTLSLILGNQQRNKPKEPPKAPEKVPFFLPTLPGVESRFIVKEKQNEKAPTRRSDKAVANAENVFVQKLSQEPEDSNCE